MSRRDESAFRHGMRVRVNGHKGKLLRCERRDQSGHYWKVRLDNGAWVWPDGIVVDGRGDHLAGHCLDCRLPFIGDAGDLLCRPCDTGIFGTDNERAVSARDSSFAGQRMAHSHLRPRR